MPLAVGAKVQLSRSASEFWTGMETREVQVSGLSGSVVENGRSIPDRAICLGVTTKVVIAITGAVSFSCGTAAQPGKFGSVLGVAAGSTNRGVIGPESVHADSSVRLLAVGGMLRGEMLTVKMVRRLTQLSRSSSRPTGRTWRRW